MEKKYIYIIVSVVTLLKCGLHHVDFKQAIPTVWGKTRIVFIDITGCK